MSAVGENFHINFLGCIPFNPDNLPERSYVTGQGSKRPIGLTLQEITELYWTVKGFKVNISVIDLNFDPFTQFLLGGGATGSIIGSLSGLTAASQSLAQSPVASLNGRTKLFSSYMRKNRVCKDSKKDDDFIYDENGNITDTNGCTSLSVSKIFVGSDKDTDEGRLCVAGPIHSLASTNGQGYVQINFTDIVWYNNLYWPIIIVLLGNGEDVLTSDILSLGPNQNNYNIGGINFANYGIITMSGYSTHTLQPVFYSVNGNINIGERCCDRFYYDGIDRNNKEDDCYKQCNDNDQYTNLPTGEDAPSFATGGGNDSTASSGGGFVGGGGETGGGGGGGSW